MRVMLCVLALTAAAVVGGIYPAARANAAEPQTKVRVGTYDSRAVAVAYTASDLFNSSVTKMSKEQRRGLQAQLHQQGFGTASVANILAEVKDQLPAVAKEAGVGVIVSKWAVNYQTPDADVVDVTDPLVKLFNPSEKTLKTIQDLKKHAPLSAQEIKNAKGI